MEFGASTGDRRFVKIKSPVLSLTAGTALARASPFGDNARPESNPPFPELLDMKTMCGIVWHIQVR